MNPDWETNISCDSQCGQNNKNNTYKHTYLGQKKKNLTKDVKDLYLENCKTLMKKTENATHRMEIYHGLK